MVDCQNTYRCGVMQLTNVEPAIKETQKLLRMARDLYAAIVDTVDDVTT
jgi:hypothetical protein